jgi:hypothetical protein
MLGCPKVIIVVEDRYAVDAVRELLRRRRIGCFDVQHLQVCSSKFSRIVSAHQELGRHVVVVVDAELERPEEREGRIRSEHGLPEDSSDIVVVDPCMEALACTALGLKGCREKPCSRGPLAAVQEYYRNTHRRDYRKRLLRRLLLEADEKGGLERVEEFRRLLEAVRAALLERGQGEG